MIWVSRYAARCVAIPSPSPNLPPPPSERHTELANAGGDFITILGPDEQIRLIEHEGRKGGSLPHGPPSLVEFVAQDPRELLQVESHRR